MSTLEKRAWYTLAVVALTLVVYLALGFVSGFDGSSHRALGILGLWGGVIFFGRRERAAGRTVFDERDSQIKRTASGVTFAAFWLALVAAVMIPYYVLGPNAQVTLDQLSTYLWYAFMFVIGVWGLTTVILYRRKSHA